MTPVEFLIKEEGTVSVDWAVMATVATGLCLAAAGTLAGGIGFFTDYNSRELAIQNHGGGAHFDTANYIPQDEVAFDAFVEGLSELTLDELDALAGFANRLDASAGVEEAMHQDDTEQGACNAGNGKGYGKGYCRRFGGAGVNTTDFLMAVDREYTMRGVGKPAHTHIDGNQLGQAFQSMGLSQNDIRALLQG